MDINQNQHKYSQSYSLRTHNPQAKSHQQYHQSNKNVSDSLSGRNETSDHPPQSDTRIHYQDNQRLVESDVIPSKSSFDEQISDKQYTRSEYYGYWMKESENCSEDGNSDSFDRFIDSSLKRSDRVCEMIDTSGNSLDSTVEEPKDELSNFLNSTNEDNLANTVQTLDGSDMLNESIGSYKSDKLNETYNVIQDVQSEYSLGLRRSSSGLTFRGDRDPSVQKPKLRDIEDLVERERLFDKYIEDCCRIYDFRNEQLDDLELRDGKICILSEFFELMVEEPEVLAPFESLYEKLFRMFSVNIFRPLPPSTNQNMPEFDPEEDDPPLEPSWPHLQLVYHVLLRFTSSSLFEPDRARTYINEKFVFNLLQLFESEDPRERNYLKSILHRIYGQFLGLRSYIRRQIGNIFTTFIYENEYHNGVADLLEILGSIINGFVQPIKEEHKIFLLRILMPLHKARTLSAYHAQLSVCVVQYIEKDHTMTEPIVNLLLRYWPKVHSTKEVMFLNEIEEILDIIEPCEFQKIMANLFRQIARCIQSNQFQVAERVLYFWNNEYILGLMNDNVQTILPILIPALHMDPKSHWNKTIHGLIYNALKLSTEMNQRLFHDLVQKQELHYKERKSMTEDKDEKWRRVCRMAEENATRIKYPEY